MYFVCLKGNLFFSFHKAGKVNLDSNIGRSLIQIIDSVPLIDAELFDKLMTNNMNVSFINHSC